MHIYSLNRLRLAARRIPYAPLPSASFRFLARTDSPAQNARSLILVCGERCGQKHTINARNVWGPDAQAFIAQLNSGHIGSICSLHACGAPEAYARVLRLRGPQR